MKKNIVYLIGGIVAGIAPLSHRCQYHPLESGLSEGF